MTDLASGVLPSTSAVVGVLATVLLLLGIFLLPAKEGNAGVPDEDAGTPEERADTA